MRMKVPHFLPHVSTSQFSLRFLFSPPSHYCQLTHSPSLLPSLLSSLPPSPPPQESRKRKKRRLEELQRSVIYLTHENHTLREQNELLRQMLITRLPPSEVAEALGGAAGGVGGGANAVAGAAARTAAAAAAAAGAGGMEGFVAAKVEVVVEEEEEEEELQGLGGGLGGGLGREGGHGLGSSMSSAAAVDFFLPHMKEGSDVMGGEGRLPMVGAA